MLKQRIITGIFLVAALIAGIEFATPSQLLIGFGAFVAVGFWEWSRFAGVTVVWQRAMYVASAVAVMIAIDMLSSINELAPIVLMLGMIWWLLAIVLVIAYPAVPGPAKWRTPLALLTGLLVLIPAWLALGWLHSQPLVGSANIYFVFLLVICADVGAYFSGRKFGKHKLAPQVSPGKTIEGAVGALVLCMLVGSGFVLLKDSFSMQPMWLVVILSTAVVSIFGDLFESVCKRTAGIKDSGSILPGHGGVLDRLDSLSAAIPVFAAGVYWLV